MLPGTVQVKEHLGFAEARWELVFLRSFRPPVICGPPAGIGDELALRIVDRDHHAVMHDALAGVMPQSECIDGGFPETAILDEVGVPGIKVLKGKRERWIDPLLCRLLWRCDVLNGRRNVSGR